MKLMLIALIVVLVGGVGLIWGRGDRDRDGSFFEPRERKATVVTSSQPQSAFEDVQSTTSAPDTSRGVTPETNACNQANPAAPPSRSVPEGNDDESFPEPTVKTVNGRAERTIHMGVRQYAWDPSLIRAKQGELVRLIIHNADVKHGLVIPGLNVLNIDIPAEGAVIEFVADKIGTFEFFCSYYCGEGHIEMQGKILIEE